MYAFIRLNAIVLVTCEYTLQDGFMYYMFEEEEEDVWKFKFDL